MTDGSDPASRGDLIWPSIPAMLRDAAATYGDAEAFVGEGERLTFRELSARVDEWAKAAMAAGIRVGDRVAIWAPNSLSWVLCSFGCLAAGAAIVPLNTRYRGAEAAYNLRKARVSMLFTVRGFLGNDYPALLEQSLAEDDAVLPELRRIVVMEGGAVGSQQDLPAFLAEGAGTDDLELNRRIGQLGSGSLSDVLFTSGTTGRPKGVMLTHGQTLRNMYDWSGTIGLGAGDRALIVNPFFHVFGCKAGFLAALMRGAAVIPKRTFDATDVLTTIAAERVTMYPGPPTVHLEVLDHPDRATYDLTSLRLAATGAADVSPELVRRMREELRYEVVVSGYGLTECTGAATMCQYDDDPETVARTSGRALPDVELIIADTAGEPVATGEQGEILIRGYNVMAGYFDDTEQTAAAVDPEGWLHTGDLGRLDERGYLTITGRLKDMFIVGGFNVYPAEVEATMLQHPAISQVAVVGVPDARLGEVGMAWVVLRPSGRVTGDELREWGRQRLANYKVPRHVRVVESLPTNAAGKVAKTDLRELGREFVASGA